MGVIYRGEGGGYVKRPKGIIKKISLLLFLILYRIFMGGVLTNWLCQNPAKRGFGKNRFEQLDRHKVFVF